MFFIVYFRINILIFSNKTSSYLDVFWIVVGDGGYILAVGGWWWMVVDGGVWW